MGIRGLTTYVNQHESALYRERTPVHNARLVIDGDALCYALLKRLNSTRPEYGGDYDTLYTEFLKFFESINKLGINVYVVRDGGNNIEMKKETIYKRRLQMIDRVISMNSVVLSNKNACKFRELPLPIFMSRLFEEVLLDAGVKHVTVEEEADPFVACLANQLDAFVVTNDSDFFVSDVKQGVVTMDTFFHCIDNKLKYFPYYHQKILADYLELDERVLPVLAIVLGNDYSVNTYKTKAEEICGIPYRSNIGTKINSITKYLKDICKRYRSLDITDTLEEILGKISSANKTIRQQFSKELDQYIMEGFSERSQFYRKILEHRKIINCILEDDFENNELYVKNLVVHGLVETCVLDIVRYSTHYVDIQTEWIRCKASSEHSTELRISLYKLLQPFKPVSEYTRKGTEYKKNFVFTDTSRDLTLKSLLESSVQKRRDFVTNLLAFPTQRKHQLSEADPKATLFLLSLQYFVERLNDSVKIEVAKPLLLTFIICQENIEHYDPALPPIDLHLLHLYCSFQSVLHYVIVINTLLGNPFPPMEIKQSLSGSKFQQILFNVQGDNLTYYINNEEQLKDFELQLLIVAPKIIPPTTHNQAVKSTENLKEEAKKKPSPKCNNRFAALSFDDDD